MDYSDCSYDDGERVLIEHPCDSRECSVNEILEYAERLAYHCADDRDACCVMCDEWLRISDIVRFLLEKYNERE